MADALSRRNVGEHPQNLEVQQHVYGKAIDLRYGTNPSQTAALYAENTFLETLKELKTGKGGPSQTNVEDIAYAALIVGYFHEPTVVIMKHENPSGLATQYSPEPLSYTYKKARDADFRAAFGGAVFINQPVDMETAEAVRELFTEILVAPDYEQGVVGKFKGSIRIFAYDEGKLKTIPRYSDDQFNPELKTLPDGSIVRSDPLLSPIRSAEDMVQYVVSDRPPTEKELRDLLTGYRIRLRSNSVRMLKDGYTTGLGTGQQDRIMCIDVAAYKNRKLHQLARRAGVKRVADYRIAGSVLVSDGFFPFTDSIELAHELGITAVLAPHGGQRFEEVLAKANEFGIAFVDFPDYTRFFDHH